MKALVTAASEHGATAEIGEAIGRTLRARGLEVDVVAPAAVTSVDGYDAVVLGSGIYAGHWLAEARDFVRRHADALAQRPVWLFSSGPVGDPKRGLVQKMGEDPLDLPGLRDATRAREHQMFAGKLERRNLPRAQRFAVTVFRGLEGDFRDWDAIEQWAQTIATALQAPG